MGKAVALTFLTLLAILSTVVAQKIKKYQYCVVGSGPGGKMVSEFYK